MRAGILMIKISIQILKYSKNDKRQWKLCSDVSEGTIFYQIIERHKVNLNFKFITANLRFLRMRT